MMIYWRLKGLINIYTIYPVETLELPGESVDGLDPENA